jgi:hypothetical protein
VKNSDSLTALKINKSSADLKNVDPLLPPAESQFEQLAIDLINYLTLIPLSILKHSNYLG